MLPDLGLLSVKSFVRAISRINFTIYCDLMCDPTVFYYLIWFDLIYFLL